MSSPVPRPRDPRRRPPASFAVARTSQASVVAASGELDLTVTAQFAALLATELHRRPPALICDTSAVEFCAARILTILIDTITDSAVAWVPFAVAGRSRALLRPITALDLERVLPVHNSVAEALNRMTLSADPSSLDSPR
ncbi:anti-anti-sigma factor [Amycolatopsis pretoriensis]|uniref:Anti-anti-sigma factor n=1 Tax=Amycolatopsis pretoriensis TaxID=218821 RepID=A0A1H5RFR0_9PSEU|nr:STAS domain-containing protein [Amycolatopsis pretoriensis]SEF37165.1 anti-anti-sigma factor [Amycolatopsis pretoriensis]